MNFSRPPIDNFRLMLAGRISPEEFADVLGGVPIPLRGEVTDDWHALFGHEYELSPPAEMATLMLIVADRVESIRTRPDFHSDAYAATAVGMLHRVAAWLSAGEHAIIPLEIIRYVDSLPELMNAIYDDVESAGL